MKLELNISQLWRKRTTEFLLEIRPYLGYALQSIAMTVILAMLAGTYFYTKLLTEAPAGFPFRPIAALVVWPLLALCPIRTYLKDADLMYLLPLETELSVYMQKAVRRAFGIQSIGLLAVWLILWPMYALAAGNDGYRFVYVLAWLLVIKHVMLKGKWQELQGSDRLPAMLRSLFRWMSAAGLSYALMNLSMAWGSLVTAGGLLLYLAVQRAYGKRSLNWLGLLAAERKHRSVIFRLLNLFIDVPGIHGAPRWRRAPKMLLRALGGHHFNAESTYTFLYSRIWLRSEWFGVTVRLTVLGMILIGVSTGVLLPVVLWILFSGLTAVQLKELQRVYQHSDWSFIYPLPPDLRARSAQRVRFRIHIGVLILLGLPSLWALPHPTYAGGLFALGCALSALYHMRQRSDQGKKGRN
ncbi:ABC transporter permease [Paenibacillus cremeus]|uniref:ABC transporter permease n=1 Tax=Paenibacillus cremeus TaxID=2163881 RepID=A0A559JPT0_9BACL|nr:ABC transporter permease [Paenibacillus cremeus]TVY01895.1 ABC transporter permease [Paenibacillus cremeus]